MTTADERIAEGLAALRSKPARAERVAQADPLEQFREDFKFVLRRWRELGEISQAEYEDDYRVMSESIRAHAHDEAWMTSCRSHFAQIAADMRADIKRSQRIQREEQEVT